MIMLLSTNHLAFIFSSLLTSPIPQITVAVSLASTRRSQSNVAKNVLTYILSTHLKYEAFHARNQFHQTAYKDNYPKKFMSFKEFTKELSGSRVEGELIKVIMISLLTSLGILTILYFVKFRFMENFMSNYGFYLFFAALSYAIVVPTVKQVRAYKKFTCMSGMMIGMTAGMVAGFVAGFYIGATNGMFWGSLFGVLVGSFLGVWLGSCCGVMGFMEGIMAGFMGGLMGAMTAVMMINDTMQGATILMFVFTTTIMFGLNYMIYTEAKHAPRVHTEDNFIVAVITFVLISVTTWLMLYGPRSVLFGG